MGRPSNYTPELKLTFTFLFILFSLATFFQFFPNHHLFPLSTTCSTTTTTTTTTTTPPPPQQPSDQTLQNGVVKRSFYPVGTAAYNLVFMSAYRGGPNTFAIMALTSKPLHYYGHPTYTCEYHSRNSTKVQGQNLIGSDLGYARVYVVLVINCTFPRGTTDDPTVNGRLLLHASTNGGYDTAVNSVDTITALTEPANSWTPSQFFTAPKYEYLYCGGSLFGDLSPQRVREWLAYHIRLFGKRSHFVIHDTGGVHKEVMEVLKPWMELGYVSLEDAREEGRFDGFYHNQMILLNDCMHKYKFDAKWMLFFDFDEYVYLGQNLGIHDVMNSVKDYTLAIFEQVSMSNQICLAKDANQFSKYFSSLFSMLFRVF